MAKARTSRVTPEKKAQRTWIVVADGGHARVMESGHPHSGITICLDVTSDARQAAGKLAADQLPWTQESAKSARHGIAPRLNLKDHKKRLFAARLADYLKGGLGNFDQLVLVAPMRFLSLVRDTLPDSVSNKVSVMRGKDLTWMSDAEVIDHLGPLGQRLRRVREGA